MRKIFTSLVILISISVFGQKNEMVSSIGFRPLGVDATPGQIFQLKYEREITQLFRVQMGLRYHHVAQFKEEFYGTDSEYISNYYKSNKIDITFLGCPINGKFKLKTGLGVDYGFSNYAFAYYCMPRTVNTKDGPITTDQWAYRTKHIGDLGFHFVVRGAYYFNNGVFIETSILMNKVFKEDEYSPFIFRESPIVFSTGFGFQF